MQSIEWLQSFETGDAVIDAQHRELMACLGKIAEFIESG